MVIDRRRLRKKVTFWRIAAVILGILVLLMMVSPAGPVPTPYVARITVSGVIMENTARDENIRAIADDEHAKALIVHINSPGGGSTASEQLYHAIRAVAEKKPVVITMGSLAASGGYITALAGDRIFARETTITGSIGVIMQYSHFGDLMDKIGIGSEQIKSGKLKGSPDGVHPIPEEARAVFQSMIDDSYDWFIGLVSDRRQMDLEQVRRLSDGRVYTGRQALSNGLVDSLGGQVEAVAWLSAEHDISDELPVIDVDKSRKELLLEEFFNSIMGKMPFNEALSLDGLISVWQPDSY
ncbi:signal peptide peptidase SppA [Emcibacter nanhaiensis]|uniref:Signal peptide peptidase SppA n=2 Tax=Emcibacter nanhaiensis TaxID=1505037 RepID=A0A501PPN2_9PROT|nr:signal peptide peptidase SppA [Emcibacter nanhaiensis]